MEPPRIPPLSPHEAELALARASADADWLASLRKAYQGRHDVLDALWWVAHPNTRAPGGLADPADGLRDLQRAVFSRAAAQSPVEAEQRLRERQQLLAEDARFLQQAWLSAPPYVKGASHPHRAPEPATAVDALRDRNDPAERAAAPRRKLLIPALVSVGLLAAILGLPTLTGLDAGTDSEPTPMPTTPTTTPHARMEIVTFVSDGNVSDPQAVLARPAVESDQPRFEPGEPFEPESFRRLPDLVGFLELYLSRGEQADSICLVVIRHDGVNQGSCVPQTTFARQGIELGSSADRYQIGGDVTILSESFSLSANGDFHYEARARVPETTPGSDIAPDAGEYFLDS